MRLYGVSSSNNTIASINENAANNSLRESSSMIGLEDPFILEIEISEFYPTISLSPKSDVLANTST